MVSKLSPEKALAKLEELCARAEYSTGELRRKLYNWHITGADADDVIESLRQRRFLDDRRFARVFVRDKYRFNRWGRIKIRIELRAKGVSAEIADEAIAEIDEELYEQALKYLLASKSRSLHTDDPLARRRSLFRSAASRGYEASLIAKLLKSEHF